MASQAIVAGVLRWSASGTGGCWAADLSEEALSIYKGALNDQHNRNEARRIRTRVREARENPHAAAHRWPFELLQNALDAGPRAGRAFVTFSVHYDESRIVVMHDGAPFTSVDLAALLSGGSNKDFESDVTTGRFGTGFLVTHVLAERTELRGLLDVPSGFEEFALTLDRGGDEDRILANIRLCDDAIRSAAPVADTSAIPSARFEYRFVDEGTVLPGLNALRDALPYLYLTRQQLGRIEINLMGRREIWTASDVSKEPFEGGFVDHRVLRIESDDSQRRELNAFRFVSREDSAASALAITEVESDSFKIHLPHKDAPRIYREYPVRGSAFVPIEFVLDGKFEPDQERFRLLMSDADKTELEEALAGAFLGVKYAFYKKWSGAHLLARVKKSTTEFDPGDSSERDWWTHQLAAHALRLAELPIVDCGFEFLPAVTPDGAYAAFVIPRLLPTSQNDETTIEHAWPLVDTATQLYPPRKELAGDWTEIALGWKSLGLELNLVTVRDVAAYARGDAQSLDDLQVTGGAVEWLARLFNLVGECWSNRSGVDTSMLEGMLPDQNRRLHSASELRRDGGINSELKDIYATLGVDLRSKLLLGDISKLPMPAELPYLQEMIETTVLGCATEADVIDEIVKKLDETLPEDKDCNDEPPLVRTCGATLMRYLWERGGVASASIARTVPLISSRGRSVRWSQNRMMMAPVPSWPETAQPFAAAYPPDRVLADFYESADEDSAYDCVPALVEWGIAFGELIISDRPAEVKDPRLAAMSKGDTSGAVIGHEQFSQVALLQPEVLNRCQDGREEAQALLGLILCHVVPRDSSWREERVVKARKGGQVIDVEVRGSLWLADLKVRAWVPSTAEDGTVARSAASSVTLREILDPKWLVDNDDAIAFLSECFQFDELDLRLLGIGADEESLKQVRNALARLVELGGDNPAIYAELAQALDARERNKREVERCRRFGISVQEAIKAALEDEYGLLLTLVDRGFDYEVSLAAEDFVNEAATWCEVGPYLLEIKATTTGGARMTPLQARTASLEPVRYVLCVVDLRGVPPEEIDEPWTAAKVESLAWIVAGVGDDVRETWVLIDEARSSTVGIRNEAALRYEVPTAIWEDGVRIREWVSGLRASLNERSSSDAFPGAEIVSQSPEP